MKQIFKIHGYEISYYVNGKFWGTKPLDHPDREKFGYEGRQEIELPEDLTIGKKTIKKGSIVKTELNPIMGRMIK